MRFDILTLFPGIVHASLQESIIKRAQDAGVVSIHTHDIREVATNVHRTVDDTPYGGGAGMVLKVDIVEAALTKVLGQPEVAAIAPEKRRSILMCPTGTRFRQPLAKKLASDYDQITLICGHYEGYDERIRGLVDAELSIGDFVLTGGELPAAMVVDAVTRLLPGTLHEDTPDEESFSIIDEAGNELLEYPHYTRPLEWNGQTVPEVLTSGNHAAIAKWRLEQAKLRTQSRKEGDATTI